ncbi:hypothetical protein [Hyphomicrobium sp.]|uniref:hypothetical protein n=1 Tax=Hyphomicrobium sp. TaxID=82 RepID=UPI0025B995BB|nr:hypothetical protein [Hyphomicrobium sp.]MCC7252101.1 hypothetical protein [Hyphomicrobium sp.]
MKTVAGWRIQVTPQYCYDDLRASVFMNVEIPDEARAIAFVRNRPQAVPGERIYAVRPLTADELRKPAVTGL